MSNKQTPPCEVIGVYAGSFDPFTIGHEDIVARALKVMSQVHIVIGVNVHKGAPMLSVQQRISLLKKIYHEEERVIIASTDTLTANYAHEVGATVLIRGIRSVTDLERERDQAETNMALFGLETLFFLARPDLARISSSMVRELAAFGVDYATFLPESVR